MVYSLNNGQMAIVGLTRLERKLFLRSKTKNNPILDEIIEDDSDGGLGWAEQGEFMKTSSMLFLLILLCGCVVLSTRVTKPGRFKGSTRFGSFLMLGSASKVHSRNQSEPTTARSVSVGALEGKRRRVGKVSAL